MMDSPLIHQLQKRGILEAGDIAGARVDFKTLQAKPGFYVIGHLTFGTRFYVFAIESLVKQADLITAHMLERTE